MKISTTVSTYLNLVRWFAASAVVLYHFQVQDFGPEAITRFFPSNGHGYVIIFFVISGFVISMTAEQKTAAEFTIDRATRIYIVAIPVLLIVTLLSIYFPFVSSEYENATNKPLLTFVLNSTFLSQSWGLEYFPFLNGPYWSLSYEVMYYLIFGLIFYAKGPSKWLLVAIACSAAGPKILALFPCWLAGVAAYKLRSTGVSQAVGWTAAILAPAILIVAFFFGLKSAANELSDKISFLRYTTSEGFLRSWIVAAAFSVHLWGICQIEIPFSPFVKRAAREMANMSYSLYLLHLPVIYISAYSIGERQSTTTLLVSIPVVFVVCYLFSRITESNRGWARARIEATFNIRQLSNA